MTERLHGALPALVVVAVAAGTGRVGGALAAYADGRITPRLMTEADIALVTAVCRVESAAYGEAGFADRQEAAEVGATRTRFMVQDAQRFLAAAIRMVTAGGVITALHWTMLPLLLLAVLPAGVGAVLSARVDYETHYLTIADRNVRSMMRWWATYSRFGDEVRANGMTGYLVYWYRALSDRIDRRALSAAPRVLRIVPGHQRPGRAVPAGHLGGCSRGWPPPAGSRCRWRRPPWSPCRPRWRRCRSSSSTAPRCSTPRCIWRTCGPSSTRPPSAHPRRGPATIPERVDEIRLEDVVYQYPGKEQPAVDGVSLTLRRGEILAVVGENGSGKSTLVKLITGILLADRGRVLWDGIDLAGADPDAVWKRTALVPQNFARWPLRARENVTLGQPRTFDDAPVWQAVDAVGMRETIEGLPKQLDTLLAKEWWGGAELSGGQWQRLACARALYRRTPLLVLDEPTSQMDPRGEHRILLEIKRIAAERMTIVITHQLQNTRLADRIVVLRNGRVAEQGTYEELAAAGGLFAELLSLSEDR